MKVLFVTGEYPPMKGGIADYTAALRAALAADDVDSDVLTSSRASNPADSSVFAEIGKWDFGIWAQIAETVKRNRADIIHIQYQTAAFGMHPAINLLPAWLDRKGIGVPVVTTFHDLRVPYLFPKAGRARQWITRALFGGSDAVIVTNEEDFAMLKNAEMGFVPSLLAGRKGKKGKRPFLVPLGNNLPEHTLAKPGAESLRAKLKIADGETVLSYFGFLNDSKGVEVILASLAQLVGTGRKIKLMLVGAGTGDVDATNYAYRQRIVELINRESLTEAVIWTGYLDPSQVSAHLAASDICVLPFRDGASFRRTTLITAFAHGLPVITTTPNFVPESEAADGLVPGLTNRDNVVLIPIDDSSALRDAIAELADSPDLRHHLADEARKLGEFFSWPLVSQRTRQVYESVLKSPAS